MVQCFSVFISFSLLNPYISKTEISEIRQSITLDSPQCVLSALHGHGFLSVIKIIGYINFNGERFLEVVEIDMQ